MLMYGDKQIGFVYQGNKVINKIVKNGEIIYEKGFTRENTFIPPFNFKGVGSKIKKYSIKGNSIQNGTPTSDTPVDIGSVGELINICPYDISAWESGHYNIEDGTKSYYEGRIRLKELLPVKPNTTYYFDTFNNSNIAFIIRYYDSSKSFLGSGGSVVNEGTFTTDSNTYYLGISIYKSDSTSIIYDEYKEYFKDGSIKPFICLNSETNKEFNKYKIPIKMVSQNGEEKITNIYLNEPLRKIDNYMDYIDFDNKKVIRNIKKDILTSDIQWEMKKNNNNLAYFRYSDESSKLNTSCLSNRLVFDPAGVWTATQGNLIQKSANNETVNVFIDTITTLNDFILYLNGCVEEGNSLYALLVLETPTEENIELPDIETFDGENNLILDTTTPSEMYIKYKSRV